ncbi:AAA family ATPase [Aeromonas veronii]
MSNTIEQIAAQLKASDNKVQLIYAFNGTGKTRLSREFKKLLENEIDTDAEAVNNVDASELSRKNIIYYNAFTEDLFFWDNDLDGDEDRKIRIHPNVFTKWVLQEQGQGPTIIDHFQRLTNSNLEPIFSADFSEIHFEIRGDEQGKHIKISKGEESNLIWSIFYSFLYLVVEELSLVEDERSTPDFNQLKYVFIDDPVSSLDDNHLIELAVDLAKLIKSTAANLKFVITTHNPLFYNILSNEFNNKLARDPNAANIEWIYKPRESKKFRLDKKPNMRFTLTELDRKIPFSYHLLLLSEIREAINEGQVRKYHFNFLRNILEKTATFLGRDCWEDLLPKDADGNPDPFFNRILNLCSHSAHSGEEIGEVEENDKEKLVGLINFLSDEYGFWKPGAQNE